MEEGRIESLVSIIIPCYNQAQLLPEAIESALGQTHSRIEVIVVDDGSVDNTAEVATRYSAVTCVRQRNLGVADARNAGFRASHGEYVVFLDADDRLMPNAVAAHLSSFETHPSAGFVIGDIDNIQLDGSYLSSPRWPMVEGNEYEQLLKGDHVANTIAVMFRRAVIEQVGGFKRSFAPADDVELLLHAAQLFPSAHHRSTVAQYRRYPNSVSRKAAIMLPAILRVMRLQRDLAKGNPRLLKACREGEACWRDYFGKEGLKEAFRHIARGLPGSTAKSLAVLLWYVRGRLFLWPWIFRQRGLEYLRRRLRTTRKGSDRRANSCVTR